MNNETTHGVLGGQIGAPVAEAPEPQPLTLDQRYWLDRRAAIIEALRAEGFEIWSDKDRVWLHRIAGVKVLPKASTDPVNARLHPELYDWTDGVGEVPRG
jgi:hypothetical protein